MRRLACLLGGAVLASTAVIITGGSPAVAQCPAKSGANGTLPTTSQKVHAVAVPGAATFYVDDRDFEDTDDKDGYSGGIWLYEETNKKAWLQTGGQVWMYAAVGVPIPYVPPQRVTTPATGPVPPQDRTLFPSGIGGGSFGETMGGYDDCISRDAQGRPITPDKIWF